MRTHNLPHSSLIDLDTALASGNARFSSSRIIAPAPHATAGLRRFDRKLTHIFSALPDATVSNRAIVHEATGMAFAYTRFGEKNYLIGCGTVPGLILQADRPVEITSGSCLFGSSSIIGHSGESTFSLTEPHTLQSLHSPITDITIDERPHVYELEAAARLGSFMDSLAAHLHTPPTVHFHLPVPEYELYGLHLYSQGLLNFGLLTKYLTAVRSRAPLIQELLHRQLHLPAANLRFVSPLAWVAGMELLDLPPEAIPGAIMRAAKLQDALWTSLMDVRPCETLMDLNYLSYSYAYLSQAQRAHSLGLQHIFVENPEEAKIYVKTEALQSATGIDLEPACGFYIHPEVVVDRTAFGSTDHVLFDCEAGTDPGPIEIALRPYTSVTTENLLQYAYGNPERS